MTPLENEMARALRLMYSAWEDLLPGMKMCAVQDYKLVCITAPLACSVVLSKFEKAGGDKNG